MRLVRQQILFESRRKEKSRYLKEIVEYGELKEEWGIRHIKIVTVRCNSPCCIKKKKRDRFTHSKVIGCYIDIYDKPKETYLAPTIKEAMSRAPIEKTWCYPTFYQIQHADHYEL